MPFIALYNGKKKAPFQVPKGEDATCPTCNEPVRVRTSDDDRARHFWHYQRAGGGSTPTGGYPDCESVAESDKHKKWKSLALDRLLDLFEDNSRSARMEMKLDAPVSDKEHRIADAILLFDERDDQLGQGVVVEVQHKNESKDIASTTKDYVEQDLAVVWAGEDDFLERKCDLELVDIRHRAKQSAYDHVLPDKLDCNITLGRQVGRDTYIELNKHKFQRMSRHTIPYYLPPAEMQAKLPKEYLTEIARDIWEDKDWQSLFDPPEDYTDIWAYAKVPARLPREYVRGQAIDVYRSKDWSSLFNPPKDYTDIWAYAKVSARLPQEYIKEISLRFYREYEWSDLFTATLAEEYIKECRDMDNLPNGYVPVTLPEKPYIEILKKYRDKRLDPPPTPFEDIQCWRCGKYWHRNEKRTHCHNCGHAVDFDWNIQTGRISTLPEYVDHNADSDNPIIS